MKNTINKISIIVIISITANCITVFPQSMFVHKIVRDSILYYGNPPISMTGCRDGGYAITSGAFSDSTTVSGNGKAITKIDSSGNLLWSNIYFSSCDVLPGEHLGMLYETQDSGFYLLGNLHDCGLGAWWEIYKVDKYGNSQWVVADIDSDYFMNYDESIRRVTCIWKEKLTDDFIVIGQTHTIDFNYDDVEWTYYINKYDSSGSLIFSKQFDVLNNTNNHISSLDKCKGFYNSSGNLTEYLVNGISHFTFDGYPCLISLSPAGNINWMKKYNNVSLPFLDHTKLDSNYYLLSGNPECFLHKTDISGTPTFSLKIDSVKAFKIEKADSNHLLIIGSLGQTTKYPVIIEINTSGTITNAKYNPTVIFNQNYYNDVSSSYYDENTKAILINYENAFADQFVEKLYLNTSCSFRDTVLNVHMIPLLIDSDFTNPFLSHTTLSPVPFAPVSFAADSVSIECASVVGISKSKFLRMDFQISPNPTTNFITIHYNLSSPNQTTLSLFNLYGQKVKTILNEKQLAGEHEVKIEMKDFVQGVYFVKMNVGGKEEVRKVVKY